MEPKLVRDRIPEIIERAGRRPVVERLEDDAVYESALLAKLAEETSELLDADLEHRAEEIADVLEVLRSIALHQGLGWDEVEAMRVAKRAERGGSEKRVLLVDSGTADK